MVNALITLSENTNRVINIVKATYELEDKSAAIEFIVNAYIESEDSPKLRPEFIKELKSAMKEPGIVIGNKDEFKQRYGLHDSNRKKARQVSTKK